MLLGRRRFWVGSGFLVGTEYLADTPGKPIIYRPLIWCQLGILLAASSLRLCLQAQTLSFHPQHLTLLNDCSSFHVLPKVAASQEIGMWIPRLQSKISGSILGYILCMRAADRK